MTPPSTYARTLGVTKAGLASVIAESREEEKDADLIGWTRDLRRMSVRGCPVTPACHAGGRAGPALGAGPESSTRSSAPDNAAGLEESPGRWDRDVGRADRSYEPSYTIPTPSASASPEEYGGLSAPASPTSALWLRLLTYWLVTKAAATGTFLVRKAIFTPQISLSPPSVVRGTAVCRLPPPYPTFSLSFRHFLVSVRSPRTQPAMLGPAEGNESCYCALICFQLYTWRDM